MKALPPCRFRGRGTAVAIAITAIAAVAAAMTGCATTPPYQTPRAPVPVQYQEAPVAGATWLPAAPADALDRGKWWALFNDPVLDRLASQVAVSNQNIAAAVAAYAQARALVQVQRAALLPSVNATATANRNGGSGRSSRGTAFQAGLGASWEPDLWGRLSGSVTAASANAEASAADLASATLSAQAELALDYVALREADAEIALLQEAATAYERALQITQNRYSAGVIAKTDLLQAQTQLANTRASLAALQATRARLQHAMAVLVGQPPSGFTIAAAPWQEQVPAVPLGLPSQLLQRRPDIAASERDVAAANATIGVQRAAYFPNLGLSASLGSMGSSIGSLFSASGTLWSLGVSVAQTVFDAGATRARVAGAEAARDAAVARYRQTVLTAFQTVEDQLTTAHALVEQQNYALQAADAAAAAEAQILNQYRAGQVNYTTVVAAQISALNARRALLQLSLARQTAAIALIQALGGGWQTPTP